MPSNVIDTKRDEKLWEKAKSLAKKQDKGDNFAYIMSIYKKLGPDHEFESDKKAARPLWDRRVDGDSVIRKVKRDYTKAKNADKVEASPVVIRNTIFTAAFVDGEIFGVFKPSGRGLEGVGWSKGWRHATSKDIAEAEAETARQDELAEKWRAMHKSPLSRRADQASTASSLLHILAMLRAQQQIYLTAHWQCNGESFYGDHLLFERLSKMDEEIDTLAEKLVAQYGESTVSAAAQMEAVAELTARWTTPAERTHEERGLQSEQELQEALTAVLAQEGLSTGMVNFLEDLADKHETNQYLLGQRIKMAGRNVTASSTQLKSYLKLLQAHTTKEAKWSDDPKVERWVKELIKLINKDPNPSGYHGKGVPIQLPNRKFIKVYLSELEERAKGGWGRPPGLAPSTMLSLPTTNQWGEVSNSFSYYKIEEVMKGKPAMPDNSAGVSLNEVIQFLKGVRTYMEMEEGRNSLILSTRQNGSVYGEKPGQADIKEARRVAKLLEKKFGTEVLLSFDTIDEWVSLEVSVKPSRTAAADTKWRVYLFSDTGKTLFEQEYRAKDRKEAERKALKLVRPHIKKHDDAEDWVFEPVKGKKAGTTKQASIMENMKVDPEWAEGFAEAGRRNAEAIRQSIEANTKWVSLRNPDLDDRDTTGFKGLGHLSEKMQIRGTKRTDGKWAVEVWKNPIGQPNWEEVGVWPSEDTERWLKSAHLWGEKLQLRVWGNHNKHASRREAAGWVRQRNPNLPKETDAAGNPIIPIRDVEAFIAHRGRTWFDLVHRGEHKLTYKGEQTENYHLRDDALEAARLAKAVKQRFGKGVFVSTTQGKFDAEVTFIVSHPSLFRHRNAAVDVSQAEVESLYRQMDALAKKYQRYKGRSTEGPAGPDTGKFIAPAYGDILAVKYGQPRGQLLVGLSIGSTWGLPPNLSMDDMDAYLSAVRHSDQLLQQVKAEARKILWPFLKRNRGLRWMDNAGSAYGDFGIQYTRDINHVASDKEAATPSGQDLAAVRSKAREIAKKHNTKIHVRKGTGSATGTISVHGDHRTESAEARAELAKWLIANGYESLFGMNDPSMSLKNHMLHLAEKWGHGSINMMLVKKASSLTPPYDNRRGEKLLDSNSKHAFWQVGGVVGMKTKMWVITDHSGKFVENDAGGTYRKKAPAKAAWDALKKGKTASAPPIWQSAFELVPMMFQIDRKLSKESANWNHNLATAFRNGKRSTKSPAKWAKFEALFDAADWKRRGQKPLAEIESLDPILAKKLRDFLDTLTFSFKAARNQKVIEAPHNFHKVKVEPPKAKRKEYPFEGYIDFQGLQIDVENKAGSTRSGKDPDGNEWSTHMNYAYGEIRGTEGTDGDKLDAYVGENHDSPVVVVIHQHNPWDGKYDEDKVMLGFDSVEEAIGAYKKQYDKPGYYLEGKHTAMNIGAFWRWVHNDRNKGKKVTALWKKLGFSEDKWFLEGLTEDAQREAKAEALQVAKDLNSGFLRQVSPKVEVRKSPGSWTVSSRRGDLPAYPWKKKGWKQVHRERWSKGTTTVWATPAWWQFRVDEDALKKRSLTAAEQDQFITQVEAMTYMDLDDVTEDTLTWRTSNGGLGGRPSPDDVLHAEKVASEIRSRFNFSKVRVATSGEWAVLQVKVGGYIEKKSAEADSLAATYMGASS